MTSIECTDDECNCGEACQNQRFQLREYADIDVIHAGKKGYGLRALADFPSNIFVYEYVGEVIGEKKFRQRQIDYKDQGEEHFYFMMLQKGEYIDATRKGGYGRFMNHSCEPNCYVDKWVVGSKMRMGIFTKRFIHQGEELTFDYNVDRYGGEATPCYCGEPTCIGYIGGKTQTEAANKLSQNVVEALGLDDDEDWDEAKPKNRRRKKGEDDEEYVNDLTPRAIKEDDVSKIMATLVQPSERWLLRKVLQRIASDSNEKVQAKIVLYHGYQTLGSKLDKYKEDSEICVLILQILQKWPSMTKNKISSSKIETYVKALATREESSEQVKDLSSKLLETWGNLEMAYRIPRRVRPPKSELNSEKSDTQRTEEVDTNQEYRPTPPKKPAVRRDQPWRKQEFRGRDSHRSTPRPAVTTGSGTPQATPSKIDTVNLDLQAIIDAATKKQEEQAELLKQQEAQKAEEEAARLAQEAAKRAERAKRHEEHKAAKERRASEKRQKHKDRSSASKKAKLEKAEKASDKKAEGDEKKLERMLAKFIPNVTVKYQDKLGKEQFKKRARELVKILVAKEMKRDKPDCSELTDSKKSKLRAFAKEFMEKVLQRHNSKHGMNGAGTPQPANEEKEDEKEENELSEDDLSDADSGSGSPTPDTPTSVVETNGHVNGNGNKRSVEEDSIAEEPAQKREKVA